MRRFARHQQVRAHCLGDLDAIDAGRKDPARITRTFARRDTGPAC